MPKSRKNKMRSKIGNRAYLQIAPEPMTIKSRRIVKSAEGIPIRQEEFDISNPDIGKYRTIQHNLRKPS